MLKAIFSHWSRVLELCGVPFRSVCPELWFKSSHLQLLLSVIVSWKTCMRAHRYRVVDCQLWKQFTIQGPSDGWLPLEALGFPRHTSMQWQLLISNETQMSKPIPSLPQNHCHFLSCIQYSASVQNLLINSDVVLFKVLNLFTYRVSQVKAEFVELQGAIRVQC